MTKMLTTSSPKSSSERSFKPKLAPPVGAIIDPSGPMPRGMRSWTNAGNGFTVVETHYTADPAKRSEAWFKQATSNLRPDQIQREYEIDFDSRAGQKAFYYLEQNEDKYRVPNFKLDTIPKRWRIIAGLDYGTTNPTAICLCAVDERRRVYVIYEFYKPSNYREIAQVLKGTHPEFPHPLAKRIEKIVVDPSIFKKDQMKSNNPMMEDMTSVGDILREEFGIWNIYKAQNDRIAGLERVKDMLNYKPNDPNWESNLFFCKRVVNGWREFTEVVYDEIPPHLLMEKNQLEDIKKKNDHFYDSLRYALMSISSPAGTDPQPVPQYGTLGEVENYFDKSDASEDPDFY